MPDMPSVLPETDQPWVYEIRIRGHLDTQWTDWFDGLFISLVEGGDTLLTGPVMDQAALYGLLKKVRDLGMPLISVNRLENGQTVLARLEVEKKNNVRKGLIIFWKRLIVPTIGAGLAFWVITVAISLLPISAKYRDSFANRSWSIEAVWGGALIAGMLIACCVSLFLIRWMEKSPTGNPLQRSLILSIAALVASTILLDLPRSFLGHTDNLYFFFIGLSLNMPRFLLLGVLIGCLSNKLRRNRFLSQLSKGDLL